MSNHELDPDLSLQRSLLDMLFKRMPMGIAVFDRDYCIQRYNPTWADFSRRYAPATGSPLNPGVYYFDHIPGTENIIGPMFERVLAGEIIRQNGVRLESGGIVTYWDVVLSPMIVNDEIVGILSVVTDVTERTRLQENLEKRVEERTRELNRRREIAESLREIIGMINSKLPIDEFLDQAVRLAAQRLDATGCILHAFDVETQVIAQVAGYGVEEIFKKGTKRPFDDLETSGADSYLKATLDHRPTYTNYPPFPERIEEIKNDPSIPESIKKWRLRLRQRFAGSFSVPLFIQEQIYGGMVFYYTEPQQFTEEQIQLGMTFAEQVALAIENARLYQHAEQVAVAAERNRLARDLHDAVTQTLFSASMIADVLPRIWERNPEEGYNRLEELRQLTRGALSEMRTLLVELRPTALADTDLGDLIGHQVKAFIARTRLTVDYQYNCLDNPPSEVKEAFYRLTQEAFNNIAKHANASTVRVSLVCRGGKAELRIEDDGLGFDLEATRGEGLGLGIMEERVRHVGAIFDMDSQIGQGTCLKICWRQGNLEEHKDD